MRVLFSSPSSNFLRFRTGRLSEMGGGFFHELAEIFPCSSQALFLGRQSWDKPLIMRRQCTLAQKPSSL
jgi:hypothetical protein